MTTKKIPKGTKCFTSILGHYNFWYANKTISFLLTTEIPANPVGWHSGGSGYTPYKVSPDAIPEHIENPIPVVWVKDDN